VYGVGSPQDTWSPLPGDSQKTVEITLPDVNGVPAGEYPIMEVKVTPTGNLGPVTVQIFDNDGNKVFEVGNTIFYIAVFQYMFLQPAHGGK